MADVGQVSTSAAVDPPRTRDRELRDRAIKVVPGGMYGHLNAASWPDGYPQFFERGEGCRIWDVDGREFVDLMCSWGPMVVGYANRAVEEAFAAELAKGSVLDGPTASMVDLAELLVDRIAAADWAMFAKNGNDATSLAVAIARAATGRQKVLIMHGSYHGISSWSLPAGAPGVSKAEQSNRAYFEWNDLTSVDAALAELGERPAAIVVSPIRHNLKTDVEEALPEFAVGLRKRCDEIGALLIQDEVRTSLRLDIRGGWAGLGVNPDMAAYSKALANGHALAALTGTEAVRDAAKSVFATGSFWFQSPPMVAAIATIKHLEESDGQARMTQAGERFQAGLSEQAAGHGLAVTVSGPPSLPFMTFDGDDEGREHAYAWAAACGQNGLFLHPIHNWFISAAHDDESIERALQATAAAFGTVRDRFGAD
jgi:glutamate-1-semialdehyde 2,1-aminomutase